MVPGVFGDRTDCRLRSTTLTGLFGNGEYTAKYRHRLRNTHDNAGIGNGRNLERHASTLGNTVGRIVELRRVTVVGMDTLVIVLNR